MLNHLLIKKKEICKLKVELKNSLALTSEKITQNPRVYNTVQIKSAIDNISIVDIEEKILPKLVSNAIEFILKDFFLYLHQTGLYNRQFKLWVTLANVVYIEVYKLQKRLFKKKDLNAYMIDFSIEPNKPCITCIIDENKDCSYEHFKTYLLKALNIINLNRLKGFFYIISAPLDKDFTEKIVDLTDAATSISKYESKIEGTKDTRLNIVNFKERKEGFIFEHVYPDLKQFKGIEIKAN